MFLSLHGLMLPRRGGALLFAAAIFAGGLTAGALIGQGTASRVPQAKSAPVGQSALPATLRVAYPAELLRVIDGDTFEARVRIWPGMDVTTKVRLRGIDAPEMRARCEDERVNAIAARDELARILAEGAIGITSVGQDKYGGRVDADASTRLTSDVGAAMLDAGLARRYYGGRRESWCDTQR